MPKYPSYDEKFITEDTFQLVIQINGKVKDKTIIEKGTVESVVTKIALDSEKIKKVIENKKIKKVIFIKDKLINLVFMNLKIILLLVLLIFSCPKKI